MVVVLAVAWIVCGTAAVRYDDEGVWSHVLGVLTHANVWHLLSNIYFILLMRWRGRWLRSFVIGVLATYIPAPVWVWSDLRFELVPTCGFSGAILACVGDAFARGGRWRELLKQVVLPLLPLTLAPGMNTPIHLYCTAMGYCLTKLTNRL